MVRSSNFENLSQKEVQNIIKPFRIFSYCNFKNCDFNRTKGLEFEQCTFEYDDKNITKIAFNSCKFVNCTINLQTSEGIDITNCKFYECFITIKNNARIWLNSNMLSDCKFNIQCKNITFSETIVKCLKMSIIVENLLISDCNVNDLNLHSSDISEKLYMSDCHITNFKMSKTNKIEKLKVVNSIVSNSILKRYVTTYSLENSVLLNCQLPFKLIPIIIPDSTTIAYYFPEYDFVKIGAEEVKSVTALNADNFEDNYIINLIQVYKLNIKNKYKIT